MQWIASTLSQKVNVRVQTAFPHDKLSHQTLRFSKVWGGHVFFSLYWAFLLQRWIDKHGITHLIIPTGPGGMFLFRKPKRCSVTAIVDHTYVQQSSMVPGQSWKKIFIPLERRTLQCCDHYLCVSDDTKDAIAKDYAIVAPSIIPIACKSIPSEKKNNKQCIFVGQLITRKGVVDLIRAWEKIVQHEPDATLVIIGNGPLKKHIPNYPSITWHTSLPNDVVCTLLAQSQLAICPFYLEGCNVVCTEAMCAGTPVVAYNSDGLRCLIRDGKNGLLTPQGNPTVLANSVLTVLRNENLAASLGSQARQDITTTRSSAIATERLLSTFSF